jgi:ElaB/YqjD/DUF883 family membrane-anchored ribosome-binding protein
MEHADVSMARRVTTPETTIPDLVRRLGDDSKHLLEDEVRLAKVEMHEAAHEAGAAATSFAVAFGAGSIAVVALTVFIATLIGRVVSGHMWLGAIVAAVIDVALGALLLKRGLAALAEPKHALDELRAAQR